jgi:hypothetical protein
MKEQDYSTIYKQSLLQKDINTISSILNDIEDIKDNLIKAYSENTDAQGEKENAMEAHSALDRAVECINNSKVFLKALLKETGF